jgi:hypothetical protein
VISLTASIDVDHLLRYGSKETQIHFTETTFLLYTRDDINTHIYLDRTIILYECSLPRFSDEWTLKFRYLGLLGLALKEKGIPERAETILEQCVTLGHNDNISPTVIVVLIGLIRGRLPPDTTQPGPFSSSNTSQA